jgi:hypothetical protein
MRCVICRRRIRHQHRHDPQRLGRRALYLLDGGGALVCGYLVDFVQDNDHIVRRYLSDHQALHRGEGMVR